MAQAEEHLGRGCPFHVEIQSRINAVQIVVCLKESRSSVDSLTRRLSLEDSKVQLTSGRGHTVVCLGADRLTPTSCSALEYVPGDGLHLRVQGFQASLEDTCELSCENGQSDVPRASQVPSLFSCRQCGVIVSQEDG